MRARTAILLILFLSACGKKGDPAPPVPIIPRQTTDLSVAQRGPEILLTWSYPSLTTAGRRLTGVEAISVYRLTESIPSDRDWKNLSPVPPQLFARASARVATVKSEELPEYVAGAQIVFSDEPDLRGPDGSPIRYTYAVVTEAPEGRSQFSNYASIVPAAAPAPPRDFRAVAPGTAVELTWEPPAEGAPAGYNIYRFPPTGPISQLGPPLNSAPIPGTSFQDVPPYGSHRYAVTAVADPGPPLIQSHPTSTVFVEFRDRVAPPAPASVVPLVEGRAVRLLWDAVQADDLAGYIVYRISGAQRVRLTATPIEETNFRDPAPPPGATYTYAVSSIDRKGNESAVTQSVQVFVSR
jgi:hypothetical protein